MPVKVYNFEVEDFHTYFVGSGDGMLVHNRCRSKNKIHPNPDAKGDHTVIQYNSDGSIKHYATYKYNPQNPNRFDEILRYDAVGGTHNGISTPHVHTPDAVRKPYQWEIPKR